MYAVYVVVYKAFRYRIYPTVAQIMRLIAWEHALRWLWNIALEQRLMAYGRSKCDRKYPTAVDQINELTELRAEIPWLEDVPRDVCNQLLVELDKAWQKCFLGIMDAPRWKSRMRGDGVAICEPNKKAFRIESDACVFFPKLHEIEAVIHRPLEGAARTCSITREADAWFVSIMCELKTKQPEAPIGSPVAIDRGVCNISVDSNGAVESNPRTHERLRTKIVHAQRAVSRRKKGSKNRAKAQLRANRLSRKARWQRNAVLHRISHHYAKNHGIVIIEDLNLRNMTKSAAGTIEEPGKNVKAKSGLNRAINQAGIGLLGGMLEYKCGWYGSELRKVDAWGSSQTCAKCTRRDPASRKGPKFLCTSCGHEDDADANAAKVLLDRGTHGYNVCGGHAGRRPAKQKLRVVRRGTQKRGSGVKPVTAPR